MLHTLRSGWSASSFRRMVSLSLSISAQPVLHRRSCSPSSPSFATGWFQRPFALHRWTSNSFLFPRVLPLPVLVLLQVLPHLFPSQVASFGDASSITQRLLLLLLRIPRAVLPGPRASGTARPAAPPVPASSQVAGRLSSRRPERATHQPQGLENRELVAAQVTLTRVSAASA